MAACLLAFALLAKLLVPAGWMPVTDSRLRIELCSGMGAVTAWVDEAGNVHKDKPASPKAQDKPCTFAAASASVALPFAGAAALPAIIPANLVFRAAGEVRIGQGLAAPPPPPTGPPANL